MSYRCQGDTAKFPEGGVIICASGKAVQSPKSKCRVECDVGSPNYEEIECKQIHGWRPTSKLECTGVAPGVVVGVLLGGIIMVVLIAYLLAKYKQSKKKKELKKNPPPPKSGRRPGKTDGNRPGVSPSAPAQVYPSAPSSQAIPVDYESQKTYNSEGSLKHQSARNKARRAVPPPAGTAPTANKTRRNTTNRPKPRIPEPGIEAEDWHFRNQGYEYNEMVPQEGYPIQARYQAHPEPAYNYESFHEPPPPQVGFQDSRYSAPPPRPSRTSGVYSVADQYR